MISPKISIIMPVYNAEATVSRMVDSILAQTLTDWELLAVDDGSTDNSGMLLDDYATRDSRVHVFHKKNAGVAMARQLGVNNAIGEYTIHADSDDWVEPDMLEKMYKKALAEQADVVIADHYVDNPDGKGLICKQKPAGNNSKDILFQILAGGLFGGLCNKLLRTSLYKQYNAQFYEGLNYCEDVLIWAQILKHPEVKITYIPQAYYHYMLNDNSITNCINRKTYDMHIRYDEKLRELLPEEQFSDCREHSTLSIFLEGLVCNMLSDAEIRKNFPTVQHTAFQTKSPRWKLGYLMVKLGCYSIARKLLKYN